ncbi:MAG: hypothetical protein JAY71_18825 [Candidatus Thiodiazotropha weberae]|nr:hypothetical protein [Candidatus Thiodiazotropha weberae]
MTPSERNYLKSRQPDYALHVDQRNNVYVKVQGTRVIFRRSDFGSQDRAKIEAMKYRDSLPDDQLEFELTSGIPGITPYVKGCKGYVGWRLDINYKDRGVLRHVQRKFSFKDHGGIESSLKAAKTEQWRLKKEHGLNTEERW